ncbi:hypothetical protein SAMN05216404_108157 [Nitrosospira multiformis]|uniref:Uncharacterized protein n=1 Tax=Nitrosospira multiformis TaxID=1231 RepID=A0A1H8KJ29_9PROT|nr:hypothetical protein [Nitrosospira multiformis]SEN92691.1 hypothetical protein SAMN05216404_108157 [Nitrosospira multiformis]
MKTIVGIKVRGFILAAAFFVGAGFGTSAYAQFQSSYLIDPNSNTVTMIGNLGGGSSDAWGINSEGRIACYSSTAGGTTG